MFRSEGKYSLRSQVADVCRLSPGMRREMYALLSRCYLSTSPERFEGDLSAKDSVILLRNDDGALQGFSTIATSVLTIEDRPLRVIFSGDTIIAPSYWGSQTFAATWIRHIGKIVAEAPELPHYWLLIVKGHRTYRYLPTFGIEFVPDWRGSGNSQLNALKDALAKRMFGENYDPFTGIVRYAQSRGHLVPELAAAHAQHSRRPDVKFFLESNPGYRNGDELVCLCALTAENMRPLTKRLFLQGARQS